MKNDFSKKPIGSPNNFEAIFKDQQETENDMKIIEKRQLDFNDYNIIDSKTDLEFKQIINTADNVVKKVHLNEVVNLDINQTTNSSIVNQVESKEREESVMIMNQNFISSNILDTRISDDKISRIAYEKQDDLTYHASSMRTLPNKISINSNQGKIKRNKRKLTSPKKHSLVDNVPYAVQSMRRLTISKDNIIRNNIDKLWDKNVTQAYSNLLVVHNKSIPNSSSQVC